MTLTLSLKKAINTTPAHLSKLAKMGATETGHLLEHFPRTLESTEIRTEFADLRLGEKNTIAGMLVNIRKEKTARGKVLTRASLSLEDGAGVGVIWFRAPYTLRNLRDGARVFLVGKVDRSYGNVQILNPELHLHGSEGLHVGGLRPIYPESPPITSKWMREKIRPLLDYAKHFTDVLPERLRNAENLLPKSQAITHIHNPPTGEAWEEARQRLAFEELFEIQIRVIRQKILRQQSRKNPFPVPFDPNVIKEDLTKLPFTLTLAQKKALHSILQDLSSDQPMYQLLQGDVGSGKTIVSFLAALQVVRRGFQVAILVPTSILAKQHFESALQFFPPDITVELLTGAVPMKQKNKIKGYLRTGAIKVLVGTHAILTEDTVFQGLGLAVIDEQHRFGVGQRAILAENSASVLAMTATPIPRTLAMTVYGDLDLSVIDELPPGRRPIITRVIADEQTRTTCVRFIDDQITKGRQIFWICPLIDESDKIEAKNVKEVFQHVANDLFPSRSVQFLHGKLKPAEKEVIMEDFKNKKFDILVSTSVIEVGVDIPNATVMVIENSERFGLAQLHQFRGRIGRNDMQSYCFLMVDKKEDKHKTRLKAMERTNDGLKLAETDLRLRGAGEIYGLKQSGFPDLKCADLTDTAMISKARGWAEKVLEEGVGLEKYPALKKRIEEIEIGIG